MYSHPRYTIAVRDAGGHDHGAGFGSAVPDEAFPAALVLRDLPSVPEPEIPLVLARFAALRAWALRLEGADPTVQSHAVSAAEAHLAAVPEGWIEGAALSALAAGSAEVARLEEAAAAAGARGHRHGERALRQAVHRARLVRWRLPPPSSS